MCNPIAIGIMTGLNAGLSALSAQNQASAQKSAYNYNAQVAANNAIIASQQRSAALQKGQADAQQAELKQSQLAGQQRAAMAANGVDLNSGSAIDVQASTKYLGLQDVNTIQSNAARTAWGYDVQGMNDTATANLLKSQADNINPAGIGAMAAVSSILGSASQYAMSKAGSGSSSSTAQKKS